MLSRLSELPFAHRRRAILLGLALFAFFILVDAWLARDKRSELIANKTNDMLLTDQRLSNEFSRLLYGLEDDLTFFEKLIRENLTHRRGDQALVDFLATHRHYVKVRVTDSRGREIFKVTRHPTTGAPHLSTDLYDLSGQPFYRELTEATTDDFSFSSMDANIVNGKLETPLRPTVRVARVFKPSQGFLLVNLGGEEFLSLMQNTYSQGSHQLIDGRLRVGDGLLDERVVRLGTVALGHDRHRGIVQHGVALGHEELRPPIADRVELIGRIGSLSGGIGTAEFPRIRPDHDR